MDDKFSYLAGINGFFFGLIGGGWFLLLITLNILVSNVNWTLMDEKNCINVNNSLDLLSLDFY